MFDLMENKIKEYGPYVIIGHSAGGQIAKRAAFTFPDKVIGIVLLDSVPGTRWEMINSNTTADGAYDIFDGRMALCDLLRFLSPFGILRPFMGDANDYAPYQKEQVWAVNLDSFWNSQYVIMHYDSDHYNQEYNLENKLMEPSVLGNIKLLTIPGIYQMYLHAMCIFLNSLYNV